MVRRKKVPAPAGPTSGFGRETTVADIDARIAWERWAAEEQRRVGHEALAGAHDLSRVAYEELRERKVAS